MYRLERTTHAKVLKLGLYVPWVGFYKSDVGIIFFLPKLQAKITQKYNMAAILRLFFACKMGKIQNFPNPYITFVETHPRNL